MKYHHLLLRQMKKVGLHDEIPDELLPLLERISKTYTDHDNERYTSQRAIEISSKETRQLRHRLENERMYLQSILSEGVCILNEQWEITTCNKTAHTILKFDLKPDQKFKFSNLTLFQDMNHNYPLNFKEIIEKINQGMGYKFSPAYLVNAEQKCLPVSLSINPLPKGPNDQFRGAIFLIKDISEMLHIERSIQLALEEAYRSNESKSLFLANMSHEIRTPMNAVLGYLQLLKQSPLRPQQLSHISLAEESAQQLLTLLNDILEYSKLDSQPFNIKPEKVNMTDFMDAIFHSFKLGCEAKKQKFKLLLAPEVPKHLVLDPQRLRQILNNLIGNAIKFTPDKGEIVVRVCLKRDVSNTLLFIVSDTGIGIRPDAQPQVFHAFYQTDQGANRQYGGAGLGLSICKQLLNKMQGEIWVESQPKLGSTFYFTLPYTTSEESFETHCHELTHQNTLPCGLGLILIVDDNPTNLKVTEELVKMIDYDVMTALNAEDALKILEENPIDLILMDCHMPGIDGYELTQMIRQQELEQGIRKHDPGYLKIIALTADAFESAKEKCFVVGMDGYLKKPFQLEDLQNLLSKEMLPKAHPTQSPQKGSSLS